METNTTTTVHHFNSFLLLWFFFRHFRSRHHLLLPAPPPPPDKSVVLVMASRRCDTSTGVLCPPDVPGRSVIVSSTSLGLGLRTRALRTWGVKNISSNGSSCLGGRFSSSGIPVISTRRPISTHAPIADKETTLTLDVPGKVLGYGRNRRRRLCLPWTPPAIRRRARRRRRHTPHARIAKSGIHRRVARTRRRRHRTPPVARRERTRTRLWPSYAPRAHRRYGSVIKRYRRRRWGWCRRCPLGRPPRFRQGVSHRPSTWGSRFTRR